MQVVRVWLCLVLKYQLYDPKAGATVVLKHLIHQYHQRDEILMFVAWLVMLFGCFRNVFVGVGFLWGFLGVFFRSFFGHFVSLEVSVLDYD